MISRSEGKKVTKPYIDHDFVPHGVKLNFCPKCLAYYTGDNHICDPLMKKLVEKKEESKMTETQAEYKRLENEKWKIKSQGCPMRLISRYDDKAYCEWRHGRHHQECRRALCPFAHWTMED